MNLKRSSPPGSKDNSSEGVNFREVAGMSMDFLKGESSMYLVATDDGNNIYRLIIFTLPNSFNPSNANQALSTDVPRAILNSTSTVSLDTQVNKQAKKRKFNSFSTQGT